MEDLGEIYKRSWAAFDADDWSAAADGFGKCVEIEPKFYDAWCHYGAALLRANRFDEALVALERAKGNPENLWIALEQIGRVYTEMGESERAIDAFRKSVELKPKAYTYIFLGVELAQNGRSPEAIDCYKAALELEPDNEEAHYNLGCEYRLSKQLALAEEHFRRAIALDPNYALAYAELGFLLYGRSLEPGREDSTELQEARQVLEKSVELKPDYGWSQIYLGMFLENNGEPEGAKTHYLKALSLWPDFSFLHTLYGTFLSKTSDRPKAAMQHLKRAIKLDATNDGAFYHLGNELLRWGRRPLAERYLKRAAELGNIRAKKLLGRLSASNHGVPQSMCATCGTPVGPRHRSWCPECGRDLRIKPTQRRFEYWSTERGGRTLRRGFEGVLPR